MRSFKLYVMNNGSHLTIGNLIEYQQFAYSNYPECFPLDKIKKLIRPVYSYKVTY